LLINHAFAKAIFPDKLKIAKVIPIYKSDARTNPSNYRPISILNSISKIYEKAIYNRLINFIEHHKILYNNQFGFRKNHSTEHALLTIINNISESLDNNKAVCSVFIDLKKAFDTVDLDILSYKLNHYGIRGPCLQLLKSYIYDRRQFTYLSSANVKSDLASISHGVPQGSILGPVLFTLYINDIYKASLNSLPILFADDTTLTYIETNLSSLNTVVNTDLSNLYYWLNANKLSLNVNKTNFILFHQPKKKLPKQSFDIQINRQPINQVNSICLLGITIDQTLTFKPHIDILKKKLNFSLFILSKLRDKIPNNIAHYLYHSIFETHLSYCITVWGHSCDSYLQPICTLQNKFLKKILYLPYKTHSTPLYKQLSILPLKLLYSLRIVTLIYKFHFIPNSLPLSILNLFTPIQKSHQHRTRASINNHLFQNAFNSKLKENSIFIQGPIIWNSIPVNIKTDASLIMFKHKVKTYLLNSL
jgi:hypothetical protein